MVPADPDAEPGEVVNSERLAPLSATTLYDLQEKI
jgi:hypothetical protein